MAVLAEVLLAEAAAAGLLVSQSTANLTHGLEAGKGNAEMSQGIVCELNTLV